MVMSYLEVAMMLDLTETQAFHGHALVAQLRMTLSDYQLD
ncbi:hypothetical protein QG37_03109 [Candidozyma auris]|uniref:Uncharacterized protein n=1 Tax=Candidozyma auris TaxID=498019 RepID=A0A0L0NMY3_CANAR|nr:hypothetical protein QG37_08379 [[Candida] auris]KNE00158.1 hypothetical protein QG37_03109 [[Candida] auris]